MNKSLMLAFVAVAIFAGFFGANAEAGAADYSTISRITNFLAGNGTFSNPSGQILAPPGSANFPSYSFAQNTHQGMASITSSRLGLAGGAGVLELDIDSGLRKISAIDAFEIDSTGTSPA